MRMERRIDILERRDPPRWTGRIVLVDVAGLARKEARRAIAASQATQPSWRPGDGIRTIVVAPDRGGDEDGAA